MIGIVSGLSFYIVYYCFIVYNNGVLLCIIMVDEKNKCLGGFVIVMVVWSDIFLYIFLYRCLCLYLRVFIYIILLIMLGCDILFS